MQTLDVYTPIIHQTSIRPLLITSFPQTSRKTAYLIDFYGLLVAFLQSKGVVQVNIFIDEEYNVYIIGWLLGIPLGVLILIYILVHVL